MKLIAELDSERRHIELTQIETRLFVEVDGRAYELEVSEPEPNVYLFKNQNRIYQIFVSPNEKAGEPFSVNAGNRRFEIKIYDPKRLRGAGVEGENTAGGSEIKTAMPGKLVRVLTEVGAEIKKGDGVLIVEAMKMQNEMKSPRDGIIKEIRFAEGATVNAGDILAVIE